MALVTVQRSPSPSNEPDSLSSDLGEGAEADNASSSPVRQRRSKSAIKKFRKFFNSIRFVSRLRLSESYFAVKGAALILPQSECTRRVTKGSPRGDIQSHLQSMFYLLRPEDTIKVAVKLETPLSGVVRNRYLVVVCTSGRQDTEESVILGVECNQEKSIICLVLPVWCGTEIKLDGDGGFTITTDGRVHIFKPVSVQAMWSALQSLIKVKEMAEQNNYYNGGLTHTWVMYYNSRLISDADLLSDWYTIEESHSMCKQDRTETSSEKIALQKIIHNKLKEVMMKVDLEEVTSKYLRTCVEKELGMDLHGYRRFVDERMMIILGQMDESSKIFDFLYLGSEWNASNLDELQRNGIGHILNITKEIDNFFPGMFHYMNIREWDVDGTELLKYWEHTFKFIANARARNSKVLVHCKMGISRSSSTVMAFAMKDKGWTREEAYRYVKEKRSVVNPNEGFWKQLATYQGILDASKQRHNMLFRSKSETNLNVDEASSASSMNHPEAREIPAQVTMTTQEFRPKSWSHIDAQNEMWSQDNQARRIMGPRKGGPIPLHLTGEADASSQSTDDVFLDMVETPSRTRLDLPSPGFVTLLSYRYRPASMCDSDADESSDNDDDAHSEMLTDVSDLDSSGTESIASATACYYDISMIQSDEDDVLGDMELDKEDVSDSEELSEAVRVKPVAMTSELRDMFTGYLCQEFSEEEKMAQDRLAIYFASSPEKHLSMAAEKGEDRNNNAAGLSLDPTLVLVNAQPTKVRADNFWIKEIPPSPNIAAKSQESQDSEQGEGHSPEQSQGQIQTNDKMDSSKCSDERVPDVSVSGLVSSMESRSVDSSNEFFSKHKNREGSMTHSFGRDRNTLSVSSGSGIDVASLKGSHEGLNIEGTVDVEQSTSEEGIEAASRPTSIYESEDIHLTPGLVQKVRQEIEERHKADVLVSPGSDEEGKPVQRSSSLKVGTRRERQTERRRTCTPVLKSPSPEPQSGAITQDVTMTTSTDPESVTGSPAEGSTEATEDIKVYKVGHETVTFLPGKVKRQTKDFEEKYSESDKGDETEPKESFQGPNVDDSTTKREESAVAGVTGSGGTSTITDDADSDTCGSSDELQSTKTPNTHEDGDMLTSSVYQDEDIPWQVGAVRQQKQAIENKAKELQQPTISAAQQCKDPDGSVSSENTQLHEANDDRASGSPVKCPESGPLESSTESNEGSEEIRVGLVDNIRREIEKKQSSSEEKCQMVLIEKTSIKRDAVSKIDKDRDKDPDEKAIKYSDAENQQEEVKVHNLVRNLERKKERSVSPEVVREKQKSEETQEGKSLQNESPKCSETKIKYCEKDTQGGASSHIGAGDISDLTDTKGNDDLIKVRDLVGKFEIKDGSKTVQRVESPLESSDDASNLPKIRSSSFSRVRVISDRRPDSGPGMDRERLETELSAESKDTVKALSSDTSAQSPRSYSFSSTSRDNSVDKPENKRHSLGSSVAASSGIKQEQTSERRTRKQHGKTHPLSRLTSASEPLRQRTHNPFYNTM